MSKQQVDKEDYGHPSVDTTGRYPSDQKLRDHGFKIYSRRKGTVIWERRGVQVAEAIALRIADEETARARGGAA